MIALLFASVFAPAVFTVGDGKTYQRIEDAVAAAPAHSTIEVYPKADGYPKTAIRITRPFINLVSRGAIRLDGAGFDYSGDGAVPRAVIQIDRGGEGSAIVGFEIAGAHNSSHNGAGIRVNAANQVLVEACDIHGNDMGIMSNGIANNPHACEDLNIAGCKIHENGDPAEPGNNHNLYLGGTSATVSRCDIFGALTGHNLKSRAHYLLVDHCRIHGGDNRQLDLVESWDTETPNSNVVVLESVIEMNPDATGNRNAIHFGQEKGKRNGTLYIVKSKVITPFATPAIVMDTPQGAVSIQRSIFETPSSGGKHPLAGVSNDALLSKITGQGNQIASKFDLTGIEMAPDSQPPFYVDGRGKPHEAKSP